MKIKHFSLVTKDYKKLSGFYRDLLGLKLDFDDEKNEYCQFGLEDEIKIDFESCKAVENELPNLTKKIKLLVRIEVEDVETIFIMIKKRYQVLSKPKSRLWGTRNFYLFDPEGNLIEIYQKI